MMQGVVLYNPWVPFHVISPNPAEKRFIRPSPGNASNNSSIVEQAEAPSVLASGVMSRWAV